MSSFRVLGIINAIGPCTVADAGTAFAWVEFVESGGSLRRIANLATTADVARLIEPDAIGAWYLHEIDGAHRLLAVERGDGPRAVDRVAVRDCLPEGLPELWAAGDGAF